MERREITTIFARASPNRGNSLSEKSELGARKFKMAALGFCREQKTFSLDEMARLFVRVGIVHSDEEGKKLTDRVVGNKILYHRANERLRKEIEFLKGYDDQRHESNYTVRATSYEIWW